MRQPQRSLNDSFTKAALMAALVLFIEVFSGCGGKREPPIADQVRAESCPSVQAEKKFEETPYKGGSAPVLSYENIRASLNSACMGCHQAPSKNGGFTYVDSYHEAPFSVNGVTKIYPGFYEAAERMRDSLLHADSKKRMPPEERRGQKPEAFMEIGHQVETWIQAGKPQGSFSVGQALPETPRGKPRPQRPHGTSDLGDCVPKAKLVGFDYQKDRFFENTSSLPKLLTDTDMTTLDPYEIAKTGTVAYNVEYPLWADNANKGRWIHVPMKMVDGELKKQAIDYDPIKKQFDIPENTRFYKTFYRAVRLPNGRTLMRRMETRIIVSRKPWDKSLFGTYQWDETEQVATLVEIPYRDGTPWKDIQLDVIVDVASQKIRPYGIPGRQRCVDCHMGSPTKNFILGFQPLQINKREFGAAGRTENPSEHDLDQVDRFLSYGLIKGITSSNDLPVLENSGKLPARNVHELRAAGYMVGNCYHCHNPNGLAFTKENGIQFSLAPGDIFGFNTQQRSVELATRRLVHQNGELDGSQVWRKVADGPAQQGMMSQMPMHTPGTPDCNVLRVVGKWVRSFESLQAADEWEPECKKENPFFWIDMDFTWVKSDHYVPRRDDWDKVGGMSDKYKALEFTPELETSMRKEYPVGYWLKKPVCKFPAVDLPEVERRPWMMIGSRPKRPFGEVYSTTPGSFFYRNTCMKCHGPLANGDTSLARGILNWSGGSVRVADLFNGLFGNHGENLKIFDRDGRNYAGNYMIWMAMEGTRVRFPPELSSFMGKHGGQMLNGIREKCINQISPEKPSSAQFVEHELFHQVCFLNNLEPGHPDLAYDPETNEALHPEKVEAWADRAAWNAGWAIFDFLRDAATTGKFRPANDQCEQQFGPPPTPAPPTPIDPGGTK